MKLGFRSKIYLGLLFMLIFFGGVIFFMITAITKEALLKENRERGVSIATILAKRVSEPILVMDLLRLKTFVSETVRLGDDIFYAFIMDREQEPLVHTFKGGFPVDLKRVNTVPDDKPYAVKLLDTGNELIYDYATPVLIGKSRFGTVRIGILRTRVQEAINRLLWGAFFATGLGVLLAGLFGTTVARTVTSRIKMLYQSSEKVLRGDLDIQTAPLLKKNCWDLMNCKETECPAYKNVYHRCWYLSGTLCSYCEEGEYAAKIESCRLCPVYKKCSGDEIQSLAECFNSMTQSLKTHLTELQNAEKTLRQQRQLLRTILDAIPDFITLQDTDLVYRAANQAFCELIGTHEEQIIGKTDSDIFSQDRERSYRKENMAILKTGKPLIKETATRGKKGKKWFHVMKLLVRDTEGRAVGLLCSGRDITEFKQVQEQLTKAQKMEALGALVAGIAHEINTPLGIILGYAQLILEEIEKDSQIHNDLKTMEKQTKICKKIVSDLLNFSRHTESQWTRVDINRSIDEVISVVAHTFSLDRVVIDKGCEPNLPMVRGDPEKLKQVLMNLLTNAYQAIGHDGVIGIQTRFDRDRKELVISVADTGSGIPSKNLDKIFDPFFTTKEVGMGTGLGLSVTFGIISEHEGRIEVISPVTSSRHGISGESWSTALIIHLPTQGNR